MAKTLYICYFGLREPLVQTQVLPYLREIRNGGTEVSILTFEPDLKSKWTPEQISAERAALASEGIDWHCLGYHKWPSVPATVYDIFRGTLFIRNFIAKNKPDVLHGRVHLPTLMGGMARKLSRHKPKLLFDIRGFFPEEYTDAGIWPQNGMLYRGAKWVERWLMKEADAFVVLTEKAREILFPDAEVQPDGGWWTQTTTSGNNPQSAIRNRKSRSRPVEVIPCCVDFDSRFSGNHSESREAVRKRMGIENRFVITHLGALGGLYRTREIADFLAVAKAENPKTFALFLTQSDPEMILPLLRERGFSNADYFVGRVAPIDVQGYLNASDVGLSFVKAGYATASRSPTKIPEYLACGLPVIANRGVGDVDILIERDKVGVLLSEFNSDAYITAVGAVESLGNVGDKCRETGRAEFDLSNVGGVRYRRLYSRLVRD